MGRLRELLFRLNPSRNVGGLPVSVLVFTSDEERDRVFGTVEAAMRLIAEHAPTRYRQVVRDVRRVFVCGEPSTRGAYDESAGTCELFITWLLSPDATPVEVAGTIVHEAQHARLGRLGFGYAPETRHRIERLCYRATRAFARRVPDGTELQKHAEAGMAMEPEVYAVSARFNRQAAAAETLKVPRWVRALLAAVLRRRARRAAEVEQGKRGRPTRG